MAKDMRLQSFSDRELLFVLRDLGVREGWVDAKDVAARLGVARTKGVSVEEHEKHLRRSATTRLAWMARLSGVVEKKTEKGATKWRLSERGWRVVRARLNLGAESTLGKLREERLIPAVEKLADQYVASGPELANLMRRQWQFGLYSR